MLINLNFIFEIYSYILYPFPIYQKVFRKFPALRFTNFFDDTKTIIGLPTVSQDIRPEGEQRKVG